MSHETLLRETTTQRSTVRFAALIALVYLFVAITWILTSGRLAALLAHSKDELALIESVKGIAFVGVTSGLLFFFALYLFRRVAKESLGVLRAREALSELERSAIAGIILQSIVHDFRNQTQVAWGNLQLLMPGIANLPASEQEPLERVRHSLAQLVETLERNLEAGVRTMARNATLMDLPSFIGVCLDLVRRHPKVAGCSLTMVAEVPVPFTGYKPVIHDAMTNLVINAAEAMGGHGTIQVRIDPIGDGAVVEVHDDGPGIPEASKPRVFTAFYTTKVDGTGLGLLSVKTCAELHRGTVSVSRSPLGGACFRLELRDVPTAAAAEAGRPGDTEPLSPR